MDTDSRPLNISWRQPRKDSSTLIKTPPSTYLDPQRLLERTLQIPPSLQLLLPNLPHPRREELVVGRPCILQRPSVEARRQTTHASSRQLTTRTMRSCSRCLTPWRACLSASSCSAQTTGKIFYLQCRQLLLQRCLSYVVRSKLEIFISSVSNFLGDRVTGYNSYTAQYGLAKTGTFLRLNVTTFAAEV